LIEAFWILQETPRPHYIQEIEKRHDFGNNSKSVAPEQNSK
jgi:hypothetical protein